MSLVGVLHSRPGTPYGPDFERAHVSLPEKIVAARREQGGAGWCISARSAHPRTALPNTSAPRPPVKSAFARALRELAWTILRPSVIFGPGDSFLNPLRRPGAALSGDAAGGAKARFQPVFVSDVADVVARCLEDESSVGKT